MKSLIQLVREILHFLRNFRNLWLGQPCFSSLCRISNFLPFFYLLLQSSLDQPVEKTLMNVKKILSSSEDNKLQTSEQKALKAEWFTSPDHMKVGE